MADKSEETRLREELAEARIVAEAARNNLENERKVIDGDKEQWRIAIQADRARAEKWREMYNAQCDATSRETETSLARLDRATAAESALAEARGALEKARGEVVAIIDDAPMDDGALGLLRTAERALFHIDAALARAGEQERAGGPTTPPPGEQGKGADADKLLHAAERWVLLHAALRTAAKKLVKALRGDGTVKNWTGPEYEALTALETYMLGEDADPFT